MKNSVLLTALVVVTLALFSGCATIQPKEVHTSAAIGRSVVIDPTPIGRGARRVGIGLNLERATSYQDTGAVAGGTLLNAYGEFKPLQWLAFGLMPAYARGDGDFDSGASFGIQPYLRAAAIETARTRTSFVFNYRLAGNTATEDGHVCVGGLFSSDCVPSGIQSLAQVNIKETSYGFIFEYQLDPKQSLALAPEIRLSNYHSKNVYRNSTVWEYDAFRLGYSGMIYYKYFMAGDITESQDISFIVGAGASYDRGFGPSTGAGKVNPVATLGFQFPIGSWIDESRNESKKAETESE